MLPETFEQFDNLLENEGQTPALDALADQFRAGNNFAELFEVLKAKIRLELNLPILAGNLDQLDESVQRQLEDRLLDACRDVGFALLNSGQISQAWMYLQPLPDRKSVTTAFSNIEITDENSAEFLDVALYGGAAPAAGYQCLIDQQGTCNAITFFDTQGTYLDEAAQTDLAEILVNHIYQELCHSLIAQIAEREPDAVRQISLTDLVADRDWLFAGCGHHLDVTHLASVVRIARCCQSESALQQAKELCVYGLKLDPQLHLPGEVPFHDCYIDHHKYFCGRLGERLNQAVDHFRAKIKSDPDEKQLVHTIVVELLASTGQIHEAIQEMLTADADVETPMTELIRLATIPSALDVVVEHFKQQHNLLGYAMARLSKNQLTPEN